MSESRSREAPGPAGTVERGERRGYDVLAAWAGIIGPLLFTAAFLGQEALRRDEFDPVAEAVSALEAGPNGWVQQVNFVVFGVLTLVHAAALGRSMAPSRMGWLGPTALGVSGVGLVLAAVFPLREDADGTTYDPGGHAVAGITFFLTSAIALLALSRRARHDDRWHNLSAYTAAAGVLALASFVVMGALVIPEDGPLHEWAGLAQRIVILVVIFPCRVVLAGRMRRVVSARGQL